MLAYMKALNRAFEKAFLHSEKDNNISELLACMGEELGCKRISIFEENDEGTCDNTYEWCQKGVVCEQILLQHIALSKFDTWHDRLINNEIIVVQSPEELREHDPDVYNMFLEQEIHSAIVTLLAFHGTNFGFCILEDPDEAVMKDEDLIMPGIRYILSSMIYSRNLVARLRRIGYVDTLTGAGNRVSLQEHLELIDHNKSVCVISIDMIGWDDNKGKTLHLEKEQTLLRAGEILTNLFDEEHVFRVDTGEFVIIENGIDQVLFEADLHSIRGLFHEHNLLASISGSFREKLTGTMEDFIHEVHEKTEQEKIIMLRHRNQAVRRQRKREENSGKKADINLPRGDAFFRLASRYLSEIYEGSVLCIVTDINYFKLYNDIFGYKSGNVFLENIAGVLQKTAQEHKGICGYIGGDNFCLIVPTEKKERHEIVPDIEQIYSTLEFPDGFTPAMGVYLSDDRRETMITLYDRAVNALSEIKGDYIKHINFYSAEMHRHQKEDKLLLMNVKEGLSKGEFIFYIQPQVHEKTGRIIGGEALVRWNHDGHLISPGKFIPVLEKTGYIYAVDCHVWEYVAAWQKSLIDRGIRPLPISVNVSRVDFYFDDIAEFFINLIRKYDLSPDLIGIEITESAFTDNIDTILDAISRLHDAGFRILMDDFGSGSSSLSMLHTMNLDVLKTDVQFMSKNRLDNRAISIVESVISMAHLIGMTVVTEGVETEEQKNNLIALGDNFAQGYYFYRPMPKEDFEELIKDEDNILIEYKRPVHNSNSQLRFREMIKEGLVSETLLDNIIRASAIYKVSENSISLVQVNDLYTSLTGISPHEEEMQRFAIHLSEQEMTKFKQLLEQANTHSLGGSEGKILFKRADGREVELEMRVFLLYSYDDHRLYLSTMS